MTREDRRSLAFQRAVVARLAENPDPALNLPVAELICVNRSQFEHAIRAVGAILSVERVLVIGSQAIHASIDSMISEAERSIEVGIAALDDPDGSLADLIDGSIGELSVFQEIPRSPDGVQITSSGNVPWATRVEGSSAATQAHR